MDLLIDAQVLQTASSRDRGIGRYARNLLAALPARLPRWRLAVMVNEALGPAPEGLPAGVELLPYRPPLPLATRHADANDRYYADWLAALGPRRLLLLGFFEYRTVLPWFSGPRPALAGVVYDLIPLLFHGHYLSDPVRCAWYARRFRRLADADALLTISAATARDLRRLAPELPARVVNIAGATDPSFTPLPPEEAEAVGAELRERLGLGREFLLFVGGNDYRKNMPGALRAFAALPPELRRGHDLVITCHLDDAARASLTRQARALGVADRLRLTGFVSDRELRAMYHLCRLFVFVGSPGTELEFAL